MRYLTNELLSELDGFVTIRAAAPGHVFARLVREGKDDLIFEGADVDDAIERLEWELKGAELDELEAYQ